MAPPRRQDKCASLDAAPGRTVPSGRSAAGSTGANAPELSRVAAYCAAVGLPVWPDAMRWRSADRPEWHRTRPWPARRPFDLEAHRKVCAHHRPFYDSMARHAL